MSLFDIYIALYICSVFDLCILLELEALQIGLELICSVDEYRHICYSFLAVCHGASDMCAKSLKTLPWLATWYAIVYDFMLFSASNKTMIAVVVASILLAEELNVGFDLRPHHIAAGVNSILFDLKKEQRVFIGKKLAFLQEKSFYLFNFFYFYFLKLFLVVSVKGKT